MALPAANFAPGADNRSQRAAEVLPQLLAKHNAAQEITGKMGDPARGGSSLLAEGVAVGVGLAVNAIAPGAAPVVAAAAAVGTVAAAATWAAATPEEFGSTYSGGSSEYCESETYTDVLGGVCLSSGDRYSSSGYTPPINVKPVSAPQHLGYYGQAGQSGDTYTDPYKALKDQDEAAAMIRAAQTALHQDGNSALANQVDRDLKQGERFANMRPQIGMGMSGPGMA